MSAKLDTTWEAPQHTIAKIEMVRKYLRVWFSILGATFRGTDLWYIDGFAGPGEYKNHSYGSPLAAVRAADEALTETRGWVGGVIHCVFIEEDPARFVNLEEVLAATPERAGVRRHLFNGTFISGLERLRQNYPNPFDPMRPIFAFIDPFGIKGLPFGVVRDLLSGHRREVLINLDSDGIARVYGAGKYANYRKCLNEIFGDEDWEDELAEVSSSRLAQKILSMYKRRLRMIPKANYAFPFEMQSKTGKIDYHLVFATQHPLGLEKMKEVMKQFAQDGAYVFSDERDNTQTTLFRFDEPEFHAKELADYFRGRTVPYKEVHDYALNESPFTNPKKMLAPLENSGHISIICADQTRKAGQYPERTHTSMRIRFSP